MNEKVYNKKRICNCELILTILGCIIMLSIVVKTIQLGKENDIIENKIKNEYIQELYNDKDLSFDDINRIREANGKTLSLFSYKKEKIVAIHTRSQAEYMEIELENKNEVNINANEITLIDLVNKKCTPVTLSKDNVAMDVIDKEIYILQFDRGRDNFADVKAFIVLQK